MWFKFIREVFFRNLAYKIAALVFTVSLWVFISKEKNLEVGIKAKLIIKNKPGYIVSGDVPSEINLKLVGPNVFLQPITFRIFTINIDLSSYEDGEASVTILKSMINIPWGLDVVSINPSQITAKIEKIVTKNIPVNLKFGGQLRSDFNIKSTSIEPKTVEVSGPKSEIEALQEVNTKPIPLDNVIKSFSGTFELDAPSQKIVFTSKTSVNVNILISEETFYKTFKTVKLSIVNCAFRCLVEPATIDVTLKGPSQILSEQKNKDLRVYVDANTKPKGTYDTKAIISLPVRTEVIKVEPVWFKLKIF